MAGLEQRQTKGMPMLFLDDETIRRILTIEDVIPLVEMAFAEDARGHIKTLPVLKQTLPDHRGTWVIKAGDVALPSTSTEAKQHIIGLKLGGYNPSNAKRDIPNHNAAIMLADPETGRPSALLAANTITSLRTAAAGAVAARYLAGPRADCVALLGSGEQAYAQMHAWLAIHPVRRLTVWARNPEQSERYARYWRERAIDSSACSTVEEAARDAGLIITTTASQEPILAEGWVRPGTHINAIGADAVGKQELESGLVCKATLIVDKRDQSVRIGEMQRPVALGLVDASHIYAELGEVCVGLKQGRRSPEEITLFDSTGVAFQDLIVAGHLQNLARRLGVGQTITL